MSMRVRTTYKAKCDYAGCHMEYDFWASSTEDVVEDIIYDENWLCLFTGDNEPRFFCPLHLRYVQNSQYDWLTVFYDSDRPDKKTSLHALRKYYEDMSTPQPLPKPECEDTILDILANEYLEETMATDVAEGEDTK